MTAKKRGPGATTKMTERQFYEIKNAWAEKRTVKAWAEHFGVSVSTINNIRSGQTKAFPWIRWGERLPFEELPRHNFKGVWPARGTFTAEAARGVAAEPDAEAKMLADRYGLGIKSLCGQCAFTPGASLLRACACRSHLSAFPAYPRPCGWGWTTAGTRAKPEGETRNRGPSVIR